MRAKKIKVQDIFVDPDNARIHSRVNMAMIKKSLQKLTQYSPLIIQKSTNKIIAGNGTYQAAVELGWSDVSCVFLDVTDKEAREIALIDNRAAEIGLWDDDKLCELLIRLGEDDIELAGFTNDEVESLMNKLGEDEDDKSPTPPVFYKCGRCGHLFNEKDGEEIKNLKD